MVGLVSPGVQVNVIDESFYTPAEPGTTPLIFVASAQNKLNGAGTGIAPGTLKANANKVYLISSQRELVETFGDPKFITDANNNPVHGGEQNEYGLQAAYSYLGVSNLAYVVRADIDLAALNGSPIPTAADPDDGTYWLDTESSAYGFFEWNGASILTTGGQTFSTKTPIVITDETQLVGNNASSRPKGSVGAIGDYALVATTNIIKSYYKSPGNAVGLVAGQWVEIGSANWKKSWPSVTTTNPNVSLADADSVAITTTGGTVNVTVTTGGTGLTLADFVAELNTVCVAAGNGISAAVVDGKVEFYNDGTDGNLGLANAAGTPLATLGLTAGTYVPPALQISPHTEIPEYKTNDTTPRPTGSVWIKTTEPNLGARWRVRRWNENTELWDLIEAPIYDSNVDALYELDRSGGGTNLKAGDVYVQTNVAGDASPIGTFKIFVRNATGVTSVRTNKIDTTTFVNGTTYNFDVSESVAGSQSMSAAKTATFTATASSADADLLAEAVNALNLQNVVASVDTQNRVTISHRDGGDIHFVDTSNALTDAGFTPYDVSALTGTVNLYWQDGATGTNPELYKASLWRPLTYVASEDAPTALAADGALWYSSVIDEVDLLVHNGEKWVGLLYDGASGQSTVASPYYNVDPALAPDPAGPFVRVTAPVDGDRSDGGNLVDGDIWVSTADIDNFPIIYRYNATLGQWIELDTTDQTTENGVLFADVRYNTNGANSDEQGDIADLLTTDYVDPDAPDPALYPKGMILWNLRRSGFNVKRFVRNYIDTAQDNPQYGAGDGESMINYYPHRWVTESANQENGKGSFGRIAQRRVVVQALQATVNSNEDVRDEERRIFNLIATPGYPELIGEMISLNYDRNLTAFVVGDTPARLAPNTTELNNWATNAALALEDNDNGLVSRDEYMGIWYPWGFTSDNAGNNVVVPPSHMVLRVIALNDQVAYPWFAPAGTRRGGVTNATSVGYVNKEGEFVSISLNEGQRDTLYAQNVNPITFLVGAGLVVFGQKTRARNASALDRVNVARLIIYMRSQLTKLAKPYLFEPNDKITRDEIKQAVESLLVELVGLRALYDFLVVCDESNNTPARIDRNELYVDIAIEPVKAIEFIYIPLRIKNTGEISGLSA